MPFPLPLSPFECYMHVDDRPLHPMAFAVKLRFAGELDEAAFHRAVATAIERHPLLRARLDGDDHRRLRWVAAVDPKAAIDVAPHGTPRWYPEGREQIDLRRENGVRIWARHGGGEVEVDFQFHHSCCDGIGGYRFIEDLLAVYDQQLVADQPAELRPLDERLLARRGDLGLTRVQSWLRLPLDLWAICIGLVTLFVKRPVDLPAPDEPQLSREEEQALLQAPSHTFSQSECERLRMAARTAGATVNDLLLRDLLLGMHKWIMAVDDRLEKRYLRIMVPFNLRAQAENAMPAANVVGMAFIDRKPHRYSPRRLLASIRFETGLFKRFRFAAAWCRSCALMKVLLPGGLVTFAKVRGCFATSVMSNLGRPFHGHRLRMQGNEIVTGDLVLKSVQTTPPIRPHCSTAFGAVAYAGRLTLAMNYDRRHFSSAAAQRLFDTLVRQLAASAGVAKCVVAEPSSV